MVDELNHNVRRIDPAGIIHAFAGTSTRGYSGDGGPAVAAALNGPTRLERDPNGDLYLCDTNNHVIRRIDAGGTITTVAGTGEPGASGDHGPATEAKLYRPIDLLLLDDGSMLIADSENHRVRQVDRSGIIRTIVGTGTAAFGGDGGAPLEASLHTPWGLAIDAEGALWIADMLNHRVRRVTAGLLEGARRR